MSCCPNCVFSLRPSDIEYGLCWRCGHVLDRYVPAPVPATVDARDTVVRLSIEAGSLPSSTIARQLAGLRIPAPVPMKSPGCGSVAPQAQPVNIGVTAPPNPALPEQLCAWCAEPFLPRLRSQLYCRRGCATDAERDRNQTEYQRRTSERRVG